MLPTMHAFAVRITETSPHSTKAEMQNGHADKRVCSPTKCDVWTLKFALHVMFMSYELLLFF